MKRNKLKPITFLCTKCGDCCKSDGFIQMEEKEIVAIAEYVNQPIEALKQKYKIIEISPASYTLTVKGGGGCPFLKENLCSIEEVKPRQCRKYPFWPGMDFDKESKFCEGLGHPDGQYYSVEDLRKKCWS